MAGAARWGAALLCLIGVAARAAPYAYITNSGSNNVSVIDTATRAVVATIPVGIAPFGVAVHPSASSVYVTNRGNNTVTVIDGVANAVSGLPIPVGPQPRGVAFSPDGRIAVVANSGDNTVSVIDTATRSLTGPPIPVGAAPYGVAFNPAGTRAYVTNSGSSTVSVIDVAARATVGSPIAVQSTPTGIAVSPLGTVAYVANLDGDSVSIIRLADHSVTNRTIRPTNFSYETQPHGVAFNPAGTLAYVTEITGYDAGALVMSFTTVDDSISQYLFVPCNACPPRGIALDPTGAFAYVAMNVANAVAVIDLSTGQTISPNIPVGSAPEAFGQFIVPAPPPKRLTVTKAGPGAGSVTSTPAGVDCGTACLGGFVTGAQVTLTATPASGSVFTGWSGGCTGAGSCTLTMDADRTLTATFDLATNVPRLANISTRGEVLTGNEVMIGGFIIQGAAAKTVVVNVAGPSLAKYGVTNALADPTLTLVRSFDNAILATNDDWQNQGAASVMAIEASGFKPNNMLEPAIIATLPPGAYTAIVQGVGGGTGIGLIGVFEVDHPEVPLANLSTRGKVLTGNDVMIAGFVIGGAAGRTLVINVAGPSLSSFGIAHPLADPTLTLIRASDNAIIASNDNWQDAPNAAQIQASGFAPRNPLEPAIMMTLPPGAYTAVIQGARGGAGVALVGVFAASP
jgi:YVTN family beta-propeller protein